MFGSLYQMRDAMVWKLQLGFFPHVGWRVCLKMPAGEKIIEMTLPSRMLAGSVCMERKIFVWNRCRCLFPGEGELVVRVAVALTCGDRP